MQNVVIFVFIIGYLQFIKSMCIELDKKMPLIIFCSTFLGDDDEWIG
jgi:hypothetical protein